jgi:hypothetical protein
MAHGEVPAAVLSCRQSAARAAQSAARVRRKTMVAPRLVVKSYAAGDVRRVAIIGSRASLPGISPCR